MTKDIYPGSTADIELSDDGVNPSSGNEFNLDDDSTVGFQ